MVTVVASIKVLLATWRCVGTQLNSTDVIPQPIDHLQSMWVWQSDAGPVVLTSLPLHPVVMGKESRLVSADWPGVVRHVLAEQVASVCCLMSAAADAHPWIATQQDVAGLQRCATAIASQISMVLSAAGPALPLCLPSCELSQPQHASGVPTDD